MASLEHLLIYNSEYIDQGRPINEVLKEISVVAKKNNQKLGVTGVLFYHNGQFLQVLEGEKAKLEGLMQTIGEDDRHHHIHRLIDDSIRRRGFSDWHMDSFNLDDSTSFDVEELEKIKAVYEDAVLEADSLILTKFYQSMLASGVCRGN